MKRAFWRQLSRSLSRALQNTMHSAVVRHRVTGAPSFSSYLRPVSPTLMLGSCVDPTISTNSNNGHRMQTETNRTNKPQTATKRISRHLHKLMLLAIAAAPSTHTGSTYGTPHVATQSKAKTHASRMYVLVPPDDVGGFRAEVQVRSAVLDSPFVRVVDQSSERSRRRRQALGASRRSNQVRIRGWSNEQTTHAHTRARTTTTERMRVQKIDGHPTAASVSTYVNARPRRRPKSKSVR